MNREPEIIKMLNENTTISVKEICSKLFISEATARRDLTTLSNKGLVTRTYGGVMINSQSADKRTPLFMREKDMPSIKKKLAQKASQLIHNGDVIILDASTSAFCILPYLEMFKDLIILTSGVKTAMALSHMNIKTFCTGGLVINESYSYIGMSAINTVKEFNANIMFFSCSGISEEGYLTDTSQAENDLRKEMMKHSKRKVLLLDNTKIDQGHWNILCHISNIDDVFCNVKFPEKINAPNTKFHIIDND